jgi:mono/diheme cytochrome c family protein
MRWNRFAIVCITGVLAGCPEPASAADPTPDTGRDLASEVRAVFSARCARCHGPTLSRPRGGFGYILDLKRLAANPDKVVPSKPDESELWTLIRNGEMPPPDSPTGPLTAAEKEIIRTWIASGTPAGRQSTTQESPPARSEETETGTSAASPLAFRTLRWLGKFHLLLLHFPIALLLAAGVAELWSVWTPSPSPSGVVRFCLCLGAAAVVPTVALGWLYALGGHGAGLPRLLALHRWLGTATGLWMIATVLFSEWDARRGVRSWRVRLMLFAGVLLVVLTAHFGGVLVHGEDFFNW